MQLVAPKRSVELTQRLMDAMKRDPDYWRNAVKSAPQGAPLAYDARLGLTESEYAELISYKDKFSAEKKGESSITFISRGRDVYLLSGGLDLPDFDGIVIDLRDDFVKTKYGTLTRGKDINTTEKAALGAWHGTSWTLTQLDPSGSSGINASFALGTLKQSGRNVIYYEATIISPVERTQIHHILYFDNPENRNKKSDMGQPSIPKSKWSLAASPKSSIGLGNTPLGDEFK